MIRFATALLVLTSGCTDQPQTHDLELRGSFGHELHVGLVQTPGIVLIHDESFTFVQPSTYDDLLDHSGRYALHLYSDLDGDGACNASRDRVWQLELAEVQTNAIVDLDTIAQDPTGCAYFER